MFTYDLIWKSGNQGGSLKNGGLGSLEALVAEGSLVAFGRSELLALKPSKYSSIPFGRLFPVVGIIEPNTETSYAYIVLKDSWNIVSTDDGFQPPDEATGHFRTLKVKVEDIPILFDSMIICRFPDSVRTQRIIDMANVEDTKNDRKDSSGSKSSSSSSRKRMKLPLPWQTEIVKGKTKGFHIFTHYV